MLSSDQWKNRKIKISSLSNMIETRLFFSNWLFFSQQFDKNVFLWIGGRLPNEIFWFFYFWCAQTQKFWQKMTQKNQNFWKSFKVPLNHPKRFFVTNLQGSSVKTAFFIAILPPPDLKFLAPFLRMLLLLGLATVC